MSAKLEMSTTCRLPVRLGFGVLGGLLGALNPAWIYLLCSPDHISLVRRIHSFQYMLNAVDFATGFIFSILIIPTFLSTFILFPRFYSKLAEMRAKRKFGFWQIWRIGIVFGLAASFLTALFLLGACVVYNISHQISSLADLWILLPGPFFIGGMGIFLSFPAFLLSSLIFAWATLKYQMTIKS